MRSPLFTAFVLCTLLPVLAAATPAPPPPPSDQDLGFFGGTRDEVLQQCKRVGIVPRDEVLLPGVDPDAYARLEAMMTKALTEAGFEVVDPAPYRTAFERFSRAMGGLYDPKNGNVRQDALQSVYLNAKREFFDQGKLGCMAVLRGLDVKASIGGSSAGWDGAIEYLDGDIKGGFERFWFGDNAGGGNVGAVSILMQLLNREGKVMYGRRGGVQLTGYFNHDKGKADGVLHVPREQLLKDDKRLERAVRHVTVPLRYTPVEIAAGDKDPAINTALVKPNDLPKPPAGVARSRPPGLEVPRDQILGSVHRVVLGTLYAGPFKPSQEAADALRELVRVRLEKLGWEVTETDQFELAFGKAFVKAGGFYDPFTGKYDDAKMKTAMQESLAALGAGPPPDAVVSVSLAKTLANQRFGNAAWDGAEQSALTLGNAAKGGKLFGGTENGTAGESTIEAVSVGVLMRAPDGKILYNQRGGLQLIQQLSIRNEMRGRMITYNQEFANLAPTELFHDAARDEHAVQLAMRDLLLTPEQIAAEDHPPPKR